MDLFSNLKGFFKTNATTIDNNIFRLHYKATSVILVAFSILVTARQYIGDPIDCIPDKSVPENMLDTFCWVHGTFSFPDDWYKEVGSEVPYPGVGTHKEGKRRVYHAYYQWVCFVLFLQAVLFYVPRYFWKVMERGRIKSLVLGLNSPILAEETKETNFKLLVNYMKANFRNHKLYFLCYILAEILNFVNVVLQIFLIDAFLGGEFTRYGTRVVEFSGWEGSLRFDPMIKVFPRMTKCDFYKYGSSGGIESIKALCVLPINIINEKIYIFIWFWFILLALLSGLNLLYRFVLILWPNLRFLVTSSRSRLANREKLQMVISNCELGDWFLLDMLSKNLDSLNFRDFISELSKVIGEKNLNDFYSSP